jgi:hypothetical protein
VTEFKAIFKESDIIQDQTRTLLKVKKVDDFYKLISTDAGKPLKKYELMISRMIEGAVQKVDFSSLDEEEGPPETPAKVFITKEDLPIPETKEKAYKEIKCMLT